MKHDQVAPLGEDEHVLNTLRASHALSVCLDLAYSKHQ